MNQPACFIMALSLLVAACGEPSPSNEGGASDADLTTANAVEDVDDSSGGAVLDGEHTPETTVVDASTDSLDSVEVPLDGSSGVDALVDTDVNSSDTDAAAPDEPLMWAEGRNTIVHDGVERTFLLNLPDDLAPGTALILAFHGYTGSAGNLRRYSGLGELARAEGFVVAYPQGTRDAFGNRFFNVGYEFQDEDVDDAGFARALAAQLVDDLRLDASRVFVTGMSNGGDLAYLLACEPDPFVRAVAPVAGMMLDTIAASCAAEGRVSIAEFHGTEDDVTYYEGDPMNIDGWGAYAGMDDLMAFFVSRYALEAYETRAVPSAGNPVTLERWSTASDDTEVRLYRIEGGGHDWPTRDEGGLDASEVLWRFFSGFPSTMGR